MEITSSIAVTLHHNCTMRDCEHFSVEASFWMIIENWKRSTFLVIPNCCEISHILVKCMIYNWIVETLYKRALLYEADEFG